ncbi:DUF6427 family protein [Mangrovibacterium diazotrophicum]|uniref:Beta-carotene 15,15'-monooxygenase n=1 Tax=Mangrovibacterium diazotrophicum TaxID=1261403 RepID=A0A419WAE4_9BACT|nr:DUF6427 family protein [Mangrovibacterium diazotrophicum]RKD92438.1 hypothetical protein BC643_2810 [Mangrovibacterium diazotrophicum]
MILRILKTNQAYHFITIPVIVLILWFRAYIHPAAFPFYAGENQMLFFRPFVQLTEWSVLASNAVNLLLVLALAFIILRLNTSYSFIRIRTFLPSNIFVLIVSGLTTLHSLHPVYFGAVFLLLSINRIFGAYESQKANSNAFDAGFYLGLGSLFYFNLIFYFPIVWIGFILIRKNPEWRNFALPLIGIAIPWLYAFAYYFFTDSIPELGHAISQSFATSNNFFSANINFQIYLGLLVFLTLLGSFFLISQLDEKKVSSRKYFQIFFLIFLFSVAILIFIPSASQELLVIMAIPLTFLFSNYLIFMRMQFWGNLFVYLLIAMVIYMQFV